MIRTGTDVDTRSIKAAFERLSPKMRLALYLVKEDGLSYEAAGKEMGVDAQTVQRLLMRSMEYLVEESCK